MVTNEWAWNTFANSLVPILSIFTLLDFVANALTAPSIPILVNGAFLVIETFALAKLRVPLLIIIAIFDESTRTVAHFLIPSVRPFTRMT